MSACKSPASVSAIQALARLRRDLLFELHRLVKGLTGDARRPQARDRRAHTLLRLRLARFLELCDLCLRRPRASASAASASCTSDSCASRRCCAAVCAVSSTSMTSCQSANFIEIGKHPEELCSASMGRRPPYAFFHLVVLRDERLPRRRERALRLRLSSL